MAEHNELSLPIFFPNGRAKGVPFVVDLWQINVMPNCGVTVCWSSDSVRKSLQANINTYFCFKIQTQKLRLFRIKSFKTLVASFKALFIDGQKIPYYHNCRLKTSPPI